MLASLAGFGINNDRRYRLAACAMARGLWDRRIHAGLRQVVEVAEQFADGRATADDLARAHDAAWRAAKDRKGTDWVAVCCGHPLAGFAAHGCVLQAMRTALRKAGVAAILGDVFRSPPYTRFTLDPAHLTPTVLVLAQAAYDERRMSTGLLDPQRLGVLADALEDAGVDGELIAHLRGQGLHVRGCVAVDACLGLF
jgi:hypothetical protein